MPELPKVEIARVRLQEAITKAHDGRGFPKCR